MMALDGLAEDRSTGSSRRRAGSPAVPSWAWVATAALGTLTLLFAPRSLPALAAVGVAIAASAAALVASRRHDLRIGPVALAIGVVLACAVVLPPRGPSHDLWSYVMYGRTVAFHHADPYVHPPEDFPSDPFLERVSSGWRDAPAAYGPGFVAFAAIGARLSGDSFLLARLWHQLAAAAALIAILVILWRRHHDVGMLVWLGLCPVLTMRVVNGGHNDLLVGLFVLAAALSLNDGRPARSGLWLGAAALVKVTAGLAFVGLALWAWPRRLRSAILRLTAAATAVVGLGFATTGLGQLHALGNDSGLISRASVWQLLRLALGIDGPLHPWSGLPHGAAVQLIGALALLAVVALAVRIARHEAPADEVGAASGGALAAYPFAAAYALPWYAGWALPALAVDRSRRVATLAWIQSAFLLAAYELPYQFLMTGGTLAKVTVSYVVPAVLLGAVLVATTARSEGRVQFDGARCRS